MRPSARTLAPLLALLAVVALAACANTTINLDRDGTINESEGDLETISPYGFVDRFGEPDVWRNEGETAGGLTMTQIWKCVEGRYREVTWRMVQRSQEGMAWSIVNDINRKGECDPDRSAPADTSGTSGAPGAAAAPGASATPSASATPDSSSTPGPSGGE